MRYRLKLPKNCITQLNYSNIKLFLKHYFIYSFFFFSSSLEILVRLREKGMDLKTEALKGLQFRTLLVSINNDNNLTSKNVQQNKERRLER